MLPGVALVVAATTFNAVLAFVNGNVMPLVAQHVIAAELVLFATAHVIALAHWRERMSSWYLLLGMLLTVALLRAFATEDASLKPLRDILLIPTFVIAGMTISARVMDRTVLGLLVIIVAVALIEALAPDLYRAVFRIQSYYIQTRGNLQSEFYTPDNELFISAVRPNERLFAFIDLPRLSSVFLEPVSLGNFCVVVTCWVCARWRQIGAVAGMCALIATAGLLIGCDGRLASAASVVVIGVSLIARFMPQLVLAVYVPAALAAAAVFVAVAEASTATDDLKGRLARSIELLRSFELTDWFGAAGEHLQAAMDSGIAYLIATQSVVGVLILWVALVVLSDGPTRSSKIYAHGLMAYIALTMLVSYSMLTIKTAGLLWAAHGCLLAGAAARRPIDEPQFERKGVVG